MYKELIIAIIIIVAIVLLDVRAQKYTDMSINQTISELKEIKNQMRQSDNNYQEIEKKTDELYEKWMNYHEKLAFFIEHDELEKVETNYVTAKNYIKTKQYDLAEAELEKTIFVLQHINDKYEFNLENIF